MAYAFFSKRHRPNQRVNLIYFQRLSSEFKLTELNRNPRVLPEGIACRVYCIAKDNLNV